MAGVSGSTPNHGLYEGDLLVGEPWPISRESILGREALVIPRGATVASLFAKPWFLGLAVATLVAVMLWPQRQEPGQAEELDTVTDPDPQGAEGD